MDCKTWLMIFLFVVATVGSGQPMGEEHKRIRRKAKKYLFHIPWVCSVMYTPRGHSRGSLMGACSIIEFDRVLVSMDNFVSHEPNSPTWLIDDMYVHAGTNYMDPKRLTKVPRYLQTRKVKSVYVAFKAPQAGGTWEWKKDPSDFSEKAGAVYDAYGLTMGVGIVVLTEAFGRSPYVLPMLIKGADVAGRTKVYLNQLENTLPPKDSCITYSWNQELNKIRYHEVTYQPMRNCLETYCYWQFSKCNLFPAKDYLTCFKSVKYADVCPNARGAALYCPGFEQSVLAILTTAPSCGQRNLPGVYTTLPIVIAFFEKAFNKTFQPDYRIDYNVWAVPQFNQDYEGILD